MYSDHDPLAPGLYLVATPIGNLEDITLRALRILKEPDVIACEDTHQTQKLLAHFDIPKRLVSYHEHNEITRAPEIVIELEQGAKVALVSDAGTPAISDPGYRLVAEAVAEGFAVTAAPGPSAALAALCVVALPTDRFFFEGFLPPRQAARRERSYRSLQQERTKRGQRQAVAAAAAWDAAANLLCDPQSLRAKVQWVVARAAMATGGARTEEEAAQAALLRERLARS